MKKLGLAQKITIGVVILLVFAGLIGYESLFEENAADEILVIQRYFTGELVFHTTPGTKFQFGNIKRYPKSFQYWFDSEKKPGSYEISTRFNDAANAELFGSVRITLPRDEKNLREIHTLYGSAEAILSELVEPVIQKVFYNVGPLMSSRESYADKRSEILNYAEDMANNGVYKMKSVETRVTDVITGETKSSTKMERIEETGAPNGFARQEKSKLATLGIKADNLSVRRTKYGDKVLKQIEEQREAQMRVQTAIAQAKEAEQNAITEEQKGKAAAAKAKWAQEVEKAKAVTLAEQQRDVAKLAKEEAEFYKQKLILEGEGEAKKKALVMQADGALKQKLDAHIEIQKAWADAWAKNGANIVPVIQGGSSTSGEGTSSLEQFLQTQTLSNLKQMKLDMSIPGGTTTK